MKTMKMYMITFREYGKESEFNEYYTMDSLINFLSENRDYNKLSVDSEFSEETLVFFDTERRDVFVPYMITEITLHI